VATKIFSDIAGAEKERDLHESLVHQVDDASQRGEGATHGATQSDVRDLAHRGVGQPFLQFILVESSQ